MWTDTMRKPRWWTPALWLGLGAIMLAAFAIGGHAQDGLYAFAVMAAGAAVFFFGSGRSETLDGLGGPGRDERWAMIDLRASALAGLVVILALIGSWLLELARGEDGSPYGQLMAVGGIAYIVAVLVLRRRS